ncbi:lipopolysaccharide biosynthesis protein [Serinibacter arcticus]|uniref:Lipopolysaccharide biosynthesis protein n=1 Tax=Serinibacter arcticus TaxID=1655435 RepID=A0A2U1ZYC2_9MICO|nr:lipopolysaccharide biosynthesis protein [Serinibacter arcticus]PWD51940.1 lipopolysaccharide biosynthesis protein [Serinibacter arcticus]
MTSLATRTVRGAAVTLVGQWLRFAVQLASIVVLARLLLPADYGLVSMVTAVAGVAMFLSDFGLSTASIQARTLDQFQRSNLFWLNAALGTLLALGVLALAAPLAALYGHPEVERVTQVLAGTYLLNALGAQFRAHAVRAMRFRALAAVDVISQVAAFGVALGLALSGAGYWALVGQMVTLSVVTLVAVVVAARWWPGLPNRRGDVRAMLGIGASWMGTQVVTYASTNVDSIIIGSVAGAGPLGVYDRAYQIFRMPLLQIAAPMTRVAMPVLSRLNGTDRFEPYVRRAQTLLSSVLGGAFLVAAGAAEPLMAIVLGPGWGESSTIFRVLAIGGAFQAIAYVYSWVFLARGRTGLQLRCTLVARAAMIGLMLLGIAWGVIGVAWAVTAGLALSWAIMTFWAMPRLDVAVTPLLLAAFRPLLVFVAALGAMLAVEPLVTEMAAAARLGVLLGVAVVVVALAVALVRPVRADALEILHTVRRVRRGDGATTP